MLTVSDSDSLSLGNVFFTKYPTKTQIFAHDAYAHKKIDNFLLDHSMGSPNIYQGEYWRHTMVLNFSGEQDIATLRDRGDANPTGAVAIIPVESNTTYYVYRKGDKNTPDILDQHASFSDYFCFATGIENEDIAFGCVNLYDKKTREKYQLLIENDVPGALFKITTPDREDCHYLLFNCMTANSFTGFDHRETLLVTKAGSKGGVYGFDEYAHQRIDNSEKEVTALTTRVQKLEEGEGISPQPSKIDNALYPNLTGYKIGFIGGSIVAQNSETSKSFAYQLGELTGATINNKSVGGNTYGKGKSSFSTSVQHQIAQLDADCDMIVLGGTTNDHSQSVALGTLTDLKSFTGDSDLDIDTVYGGFEKCFRDLMVKYTGVPMMFMDIQLVSNKEHTNNSAG